MFLAVDASDSHVGTVLPQMISGSWSLLAFFSKKFSTVEAKYSAFNRELLAAYSSVCHFLFLLEGQEFALFTDHKPLTHAPFPFLSAVVCQAATSSCLYR